MVGLPGTSYGDKVQVHHWDGDSRTIFHESSDFFADFCDLEKQPDASLAVVCKGLMLASHICFTTSTRQKQVGLMLLKRVMLLFADSAAPPTKFCAHRLSYIPSPSSVTRCSSLRNLSHPMGFQWLLPYQGSTILIKDTDRPCTWQMVSWCFLGAKIEKSGPCIRSKRSKVGGEDLDRPQNYCHDLKTESRWVQNSYALKRECRKILACRNRVETILGWFQGKGG